MADGNIKSIKDATHWRQLVKSNWLRGIDLDASHDTILTVKSIEYRAHPGGGIEEALTVITWAEEGYKPYGCGTVENFKALESVYGTPDPNKWKPGVKLALYPKSVTAFGETAPAVRIRQMAVNPINAEQLKTLKRAIAESGSTVEKVESWKGCTIEEMPATMLDEVLEMLTRRKAKNDEEAEKAGA